jgi:hypothetical protein
VDRVVEWRRLSSVTELQMPLATSRNRASILRHPSCSSRHSTDEPWTEGSALRHSLTKLLSHRPTYRYSGSCSSNGILGNGLESHRKKGTKLRRFRYGICSSTARIENTNSSPNCAPQELQYSCALLSTPLKTYVLRPS